VAGWTRCFGLALASGTARWPSCYSRRTAMLPISTELEKRGIGLAPGSDLAKVDDGGESEMADHEGKPVLFWTPAKLWQLCPSFPVPQLDEVGEPGEDSDQQATVPNSPRSTPRVDGQRSDIAFYLSEDVHSRLSVTRQSTAAADAGRSCTHVTAP